MAKHKTYNPRQYSLFDDEFNDSSSQTMRGGRDIAPMQHVPELDMPLDDTDNSKVLKFISFGSGSSGNCSFVGTDEAGILIDAGVDMKLVLDTLKDNNISLSAIKGICLTHDHGDHVRYAYTLLRRLKVNVYCTNRVLQGIFRKHSISKRIRDYHTPVYKEIPFKLAGFEITAFEVSHDGTCNSGYNIHIGDTNFVLATDLGTITDRAFYYMSDADYLVIESNYDAKMLRDGKYPEYLKSRIFANTGHLDNVECADFLADQAGGRLKYAFLCHLSKDNNTPEIALETSRKAIESRGFTVGKGEGSIEDEQKDIQLIALPRFDATRCYKFMVTLKSADNFSSVRFSPCL